jgi:hypothetical protein
MGYFDAFRDNGGPTQYGPQFTAVTEDVLVVGLIVGFALLLFTTIIVLPGLGGKQCLFTFVKALLALYVGAVILVCNYGYGWESGSVHTKTSYKTRTAGEHNHEVYCNIGVKLGLRGINVTMKGTPITQKNATINYNERFSWEWNQGRLGFGPYAGRINRELRAAQYRGLPIPILSIVEYFTLDGENIRWGRAYREAGYYTHIMMWTAFPLWLLSLLLFNMVLSLGALFLALTGSTLILANILFSALSQSASPVLEIPFEDGIIELSYGWSYILVLLTGIQCILGAAAVIFMDYRYPRQLAKFFGMSVQDNEEDMDADMDEEENAEENADEDAELQNVESEDTVSRSTNGHHCIQIKKGSPNTPTPTSATTPVAGPTPTTVNRRLTSTNLRATRRRPSCDMKPPKTAYLQPGYVNITFDGNGRIKAETPTRPMPPIPARRPSKPSLLVPRQLSNVDERSEDDEESCM